MDANEMTQKAENRAKNLQQTVQEKAEDLQQTAQEWGNKAKGAARDAGAAADLYVHEYAWTSVVLVALAVGVVGYFLGSRRT